MKRTATQPQLDDARRTALKAEWIALLEEIRSGVPADVTEEEIERDIAQAIEAARREQDARCP